MTVDFNKIWRRSAWLYFYYLQGRTWVIIVIGFSKGWKKTTFPAATSRTAAETVDAVTMMLFISVIWIMTGGFRHGKTNDDCLRVKLPNYHGHCQSREGNKTDKELNSSRFGRLSFIAFVLYGRFPAAEWCVWVQNIPMAPEEKANATPKCFASS